MKVFFFSIKYGGRIGHFTFGSAMSLLEDGVAVGVGVA